MNAAVQSMSEVFYLAAEVFDPVTELLSGVRLLCGHGAVLYQAMRSPLSTRLSRKPALKWKLPAPANLARTKLAVHPRKNWRVASQVESIAPSLDREPLNCDAVTLVADWAATSETST